MGLMRTAMVMGMFARLAGRVPLGHLWYLLRRMRNEKPHRFAGQIRINTFFPPYPSMAFDRFCRHVIQRRRAPFSTYLALTARCPFTCPHCSYAHRTGAEMSPPQMLDVVAQIKAIGTCTLGLTGGEPLLRDDLEDLIAAAGPEMATIVFTTGWHLDAARARRLAKAGVTCVTVGLESADAETHDRVRGQDGSFDQARRAVATCIDRGIYTAVGTVGFRERIAGGDLQRLYDLAEKWGARELRVLSPAATGGIAGCAAAMLAPEEAWALADFHAACNRRRKGPAVASFAYLESDELFGCGAGYHHLFVDASGEVCPCDLTPLSFGNACDEPLADIWARMGQHFPHPRRGCLLHQLADRLPPEAALPLSPDQSRSLCPDPPHTPLPEGYRRLLPPP